MGDSLRYKDWFEKAVHDLHGAEILMEHDGGNDLVAFHCQQAMEKTLKGWLLMVTNELLEGHSLVFLCRKAISEFCGIAPQDITFSKNEYGKPFADNCRNKDHT